MCASLLRDLEDGAWGPQGVGLRVGVPVKTNVCEGVNAGL